MPGYALRFRLLPLAVLLCVGSCLSTEGYYRYQDAGAAGTTGAAGTAGPGTAGTGSGVAGTTGSGGSSGGSAAGTTGAAGTIATGRGGTTGAAGTGTTGRGGTTGTAGVTGSGGGGVLFMDDFEGANMWDFGVSTMPPIITDGTKVLNMSETAGSQRLAAAGMGTWTNLSIEARVKVLAFTGTTSSDVVAICARLTDATHFYYFAIQATDLKAKIKIQNDGNSSLSSSIDVGFTVNTWFKLRMDVVGPTINVYVNDVMKGTYTATGADILPMGGVGLMVQRTNAEFDDVVVRSIP